MEAFWCTLHKSKIHLWVVVLSALPVIGANLKNRIVLPFPEESSIITACTIADADGETVLRLTCPNDTVVTANIYGGASPVDNCTNPQHSDCLFSVAHPPIDRSCLWDEEHCEFTVGGVIESEEGGRCGVSPAYPVTSFTALDVKCVPKLSIFDVCGDGGYLMERGYVVSPSFPMINLQRTNCSLVLSNHETKAVDISVLEVRMDPAFTSIRISFHDEDGNLKEEHSIYGIVNISVCASTVQAHYNSALVLSSFLLWYEVSDCMSDNAGSTSTADTDSPTEVSFQISDRTPADNMFTSSTDSDRTLADDMSTSSTDSDKPKGGSDQCTTPGHIAVYSLTYLSVLSSCYR